VKTGRTSEERTSKFSDKGHPLKFFEFPSSKTKIREDL